jgi:hypothetical protein
VLRFPAPAVLNSHTRVRLSAIGVALNPAFPRGAFAADCSSTEI